MGSVVDKKICSMIVVYTFAANFLEKNTSQCQLNFRKLHKTGFICLKYCKVII